ncbi:MAG: hypothetical protein Q4F65_14560 [Propionibacteriaceae bacterium]|nr:hypothetical protein [Propionibacteriaceae bacterium]
MDIAYVAGLIDGEGCIHLGTRKGTYRARVTVGMTEVALPLLRELQEEWQGSIYCSRQPTEKWAGAWVWSVQGAPARVLLESLTPHLRLKKEQATLALEVEDIRSRLARMANGSGRWTPEARVACEAIKMRLHSLNAKGPRESVTTVEVA